MKRREFIAGLGSAVAWPLKARAQQGERIRRIGVLVPYDENDPKAKARLSAFTQALADLGWTDRNVGMDIRWGGGDASRMRTLAHELVGLKPDIIATNTSPATVAVQRETQTIPIVFASVSDPVAQRIVPRLDRPSGNITGFADLAEASLGGKYLDLLWEIVPGLERAAVLFNPDTTFVSAYITSFEIAARSLKVVPIFAPVHDDVEIEKAIIDFGRDHLSGLVVMPDIFMYVHRASIISAAARNNVPAVYFLSDFAKDGGLLSYGNDVTDTFRRAATYVDRILRGAKPGDLPVQYPVKYEMAVNLKTAKALGLTIPPNLLAVADEVIE